ncbi:MAG: glycoside hydrolase family 30 beta sandwich domain-containing protein [Ferruginibacter sp.]
MRNSNRYNFILPLLLLSLMSSSCKKSTDSSGNGGGTTPPVVTPPVTVSFDVACWLTTSDRANLIAKQNIALNWGTNSNSLPTMLIDSTIQYQTIDGFGYTLTQGSAYVINQLAPADRTALLNELFGSSDNSIGVSFLRVGIGATDLSSSVYTYDDMPAGQTDPTLANFSLNVDMPDVIPILQQIVSINPSIKILATPWSAPVWMKDNNSFVGGSLLPAYYTAYANYFVKYIQAMQLKGIGIYAITPQNEPLHAGNNPSLYMTAIQEAAFIKNNLGPAFNTAGISTKIIAYDHNCDRPDYPLDVLSDAAARPFIDGSAFHLYAGDISALTTVHTAYPTKNVYFTEQYTPTTGAFSGDLRWHLRNVIIGSMRNWSKTAIEWNLANDPFFSPHTTGGCTTCLGALTIGNGTVTRNVAYYIIAQASKFIPPNSVRIASDNNGNLQTVAFLKPGGQKVLIVLNDGTAVQGFNIKFNNKWFTANLDAGAVATYTW